jgi:hypothetical protein
VPTSLLEIVDLGDGEIVLQRAEETVDESLEGSVEGGAGAEPRGKRRTASTEPLVTIRFSEESRVYIMDQSMEVAKAMIQAGIQAAAQLAEQADVEMEVDSVPGASRTLH